MTTLSSPALIALALLAAFTMAAGDEPSFTTGACGGLMMGFDGRSYACGPDRRPACERSTGQRCRCLERRDCGGRQDEPF